MLSTMFKSPKKSLNLKKMRLLNEIELTGLADTEPSVSTDFNHNLMFHRTLNFQATINRAYCTEESAQAREGKEIVDDDILDEVDLDIEDLAHLIKQAKVLKKNVKTLNRNKRVDANNTISNSGQK